jgi:DmsE family decaheme c-type cytochrome
MQPFSEKLPTEINDTCTTCHSKGDQAFWDGSQHEGRDLSCVSCHSVHSPESDDSQLALPTQTVTCAQCHQDKVAQVQRTTHMPVREGTMQCASCHNPHGSVNDRLLKEGFTLNESCTTSCHAEKRGPFMFEHAAVVEDCATCHDPHGSVNDRMLTAKQPMLCQRCHNHTRHPPRVYDAISATSAPQAFARSCVNCHQTIHGSNHPSGKRFLR